MNKPVISVITICFNCAEALDATLKNVLSQKFKGMEIIVVDGGSHDHTPEILARYANDIALTISEPDDGIYDAINKGVSHANGEWVVCMNAGDCFASSDVLNRVFSLDIPDHIDFIYSDYLKKSATGNITRYETDRRRGEVFHQSSIYRRSLHDRHGYYAVTHPYIVSDLLFFLQVPENSFMKVDFPISISEESGVSSGLWCREQALSLRVVFGMESINSAFLKYWSTRAKSIIPERMRRTIKQWIH